MKKNTNQFNVSHVDRMNYGGAKFCRFALFPLMLFMLLLLPARMVAQTTTEDPRYALFNGLDGIKDITITDNGDYPWRKLDLNADGMENLGFTIPEDSKGLMSSNYNVNKSSSETVIKFNVSKPILLTSQVLVSSEYYDKFYIYVDNKLDLCISKKKQTEYKVLLSPGEHSLKLCYQKDAGIKEYAGRAFIYDLKTATTFSEYVAEYDATNTTLTFKNITSSNLEDQSLHNIVIMCKAQTVSERCSLLNIEKSAIKNIVFDKSFNTYAPTSLNSFFKDLTELETIKDLKYLNTENVENMEYMFLSCNKLSSLDLSSFNTTKVQDMSGMFCNCEDLSSLDLSSFNTAKVQYMQNMFNNCYNLSSLNLSSFNTANVQYMKNMFYNCQNLSSLDLSSFNTAKVEDMSCMFSYCRTLPSLDLSSFNTAKVQDMQNMFYNCQNLSSLDLSSFNTAKVKNMLGMFYNCQNLSSLDLSSFNTAKVEEMSGMFFGCFTLTTIYAGDNFVTTNVLKGRNMFYDCNSLKGAIDKYDGSKTDHTYANYKTGYFSKLVGKNGEEKIGATGETLSAEELTLADGKDFVAYEPFAVEDVSYSRTIKTGTTWGTLCLPFAIDQSQETECKFYRLTGIDNDCITLESYEGAEIPAGTPVLFKMNEGVQELEISAQNADLVKEPVAGTDSDVNLVGSFTKIGGKDNKGLDKNDYIIGKDKFWRVSDLDGGNRVGIKPMRAYIHPATASQVRAAMLSIGKGDGTTAIDNLNAISNDANAEYYDANGRRTNGLQKGLNIVKRGSKTYKIMVK